MLLKTVIIDDEQQALNLLTTYCKQAEQLDLVARFTDPLQAMHFINNNQIDLLISDIDMPGISGIELSNSLLQPVATIFITAHSEFAINGFDLDVIDYLLKPVIFPRFLKAINKVNQRITMMGKSMVNSSHPNNPDFIFVKMNGARLRINVVDIFYIESQRDYVIIYLKTKHYMVLQTLTNIIEVISNPLFIQIHRSFVVNLAHVDSVEKDHLFINNIDLTIGKTYRTDLLSKLS
ncbi:MAG: two-component system LytT family response regulator [Colwellia sp.]|jgi:two-component system LytT family response regulator